MEFQPPRFTVPLEGVVAEEQASVTFEAVVTGFPIPAIKWLHEGRDVSNAMKYDITKDKSGRCTLTIPVVFAQDSGMFTCYATNGTGEAETSAELFVKSGSGAPQFLQPLQDVSAKQGETVQLQVKVVGNPPPRVQWHREGAEIYNSEDFRVSKEGDVHSLTIMETYVEDTGRFTATAVNKVGRAISRAILTVSGEGSVIAKIAPASANVKPDSAKSLDRDAPSDDDFVQSSRKQGPRVAAKPLRKQSPSPIRRVRMSPPKMHPALAGNPDQLSPQRRQFKSVKPPSPSRVSRSPATDAHGRPLSSDQSLDDAATKIQASFKGYKTRKDLDMQRESATKIQAAYRGFRTRSKLEDGPNARRAPSPKILLRNSQSPENKKPPRAETAVFPPFFKVPIKNVEVVEGEMSQFECTVYGNPAPLIKWYREGALIESSPDFMIHREGSVSTLLIKETFIDDAGMFTCNANNKAGSASCSALLTVTVPEDETPAASKPGISRTLSETELSMTDYDGFESTELDFVSGVSDVELTDTEYGKPTTSAVHHLAVAETNYGKKLSPVAEESSSTPSGKTAEHSPISPGKKGTGSRPSLLSSPPSTIRVIEGSSVRLSFVIIGTPTPNATWMKDGKPITGGHRIKLSENAQRNSYTLAIDLLLAEDTGNYSITANNVYGFVEGNVKLIMEDEYAGYEYPKSEKMNLMPPQSPTSRGRGETRRTPTDRQPVTAGEVRLSSLSPGRIDRRSVSPGGRRLDDVEELDIEKCFKPRFVRKPENLECNEGTAIRIDCKISGRPMPEVMWHHNGVLMHEDYSHRVVVKEDGVRSLIVSPASTRDGGEYTVVAQNKAGKAVSSVSLTVIPNEGTERPRILEKPQSVNVTEGDMVRLEVFAVGRPTPEIVWLKDNVLLIPDKHPDLRIEGVDGHGLLTIPSAIRALHDAWYTATAVNKVGRDLTRCKVKVQLVDIEPEPERKLYIPKSARKILPPEASPDRIDRKVDNFDENDLYDEKGMQKPRFKKKLTPVKQKILGSAHFECHLVPIGDPSMKIEWLLDGKPIEFANRIMITYEFGYCALDINAVYPRDSGVISCRATNAHGQVQTSTTLAVKDTKGLVEATQLPETRQLHNIEKREREFKGIGEKYVTQYPEEDETPRAPQIVLDLDPARVKEGEPARFRCRIMGYPPAKVEWFLNEQAIRKSKRFRIWYDGIHYFEIAHVRGYDTGEIRMVATNSQGHVESRAALEVFQAEDFRSVLHHAEKVAMTDGDTDLTVKRYRTSRAIEDQLREENARRMVTQLKSVEKPMMVGQKKVSKNETGEELQSKFMQLSEEEHVKKTYQVEKRIPSEFRDREYVKHIRDTRSSLTHWNEDKEESETIPWLQRPKETIGGFQTDKVEYMEDSEAPVILERVRNVTVTQGKDARLTVRFYGKPRPDITWLLNGKPLEKSERVSWMLIEDFVSELTIRRLTKEDSGAVGVAVKNCAGEAGSQAFLLVQEHDVLRFTHPLQDVMAKETDRSCIFECSLSEPYMKVEWRTTAGRKGTTAGYETVLKEGDKYRMNCEGKHHFLRIADIKMEDAGTYYCVVVGQDDKQTAADLVVDAVPRKITSGLNDMTSREGFQNRYEVTVSHEDVSGTWLKDGVVLAPSAKYEISEFGRRRRLNINDLSIEDEGLYEYVYNGDSSSSYLSVTALPCNIVQTLSDQTAFAGNTVKFEAKLSLFGAKCYWFKDGVPLIESERINISSDLKTHTLTIYNCRAEDIGQYSLKAGANETTAELVVQDIAITGFLRDQNVLESQSTILECSVDVPGYFDGIWLHNEKLITNTEYHVIETKRTSQLLTLTNVTADDTGTYSYVTGSGTGTEAKLFVLPISVTKPLHDVTDAETKTVKLELEVSHDSVNGTWWKDGVQLQGSESEKFVFGSKGKIRVLEIRNLTVDDQGTYEFRAGKQSSSCRVHVQGASITKPLHDTKVLETSTIALSCEVVSDGVYGVWKRNGVEIDFNSPNCKDMYKVNGKTHILILEDIDQDHAGTYTFQFGSVRTSCQVDVEGIKLSKALRNIHVSDASDAVFNVEVAQDGVRNAKWERNGVEIKHDGSKYVMHTDGKKHTLTVKNVSHQDVAAYSFVVGSAKSSGRIYVDEIEIVRGLQDQHIMEKRIAEFVVEVDSDNVNGYWTKDGVQLQPSQKHQIRSERHVHQLTVSNICEEDSGLYTFHSGRSKTSGRLSVEAVNIKSGIKSKAIKETQTAEFECTVSHPDITSNMYSWTKNGVKIQNSDRISISVEGYRHKLTIRDCTTNDSGEYAFHAGQDKCKASLDVQVVRVVRPLAPKQKVSAHETVVFETQIDAPDVKAYWVKDGRRIDVTSRMTDSSTKFEAKAKDSVHTLKIKDVDAEDEGVYTLFAGRELTSTCLYVEVVNVDITKCTKTVSVVENHRATLEFKVSKPDVQAHWYKQGIEIDFTIPRYQYVVDDRTHRLYVEEVTFADEGEYTFQAGNQKATTYLYVQPPEPPRFVQELRNCIVIAGEQARFTVRISGRPEPIVTWFKEGINITPNFKYKVLHDEDQHTLVVVGVEETDSGKYTCEARNELGLVRSSATLEVDNKDKMPAIHQPDVTPPEIIDPIQDFITREGQSARFQCKVTGTVAPPKVMEPLQPAHVIEGSPVKFECIIHGDNLDTKWYLAGRDVTKDSRYQWKLEENGRCWLVIENCQIKDSGEVRCYCSNSGGEAVCTTDLIVSGLFDSSTDQDVTVGQEHVNGSTKENDTHSNEDDGVKQSLNLADVINDVVNGANGEKDSRETLLVTSTMTGKEFTIYRSDVTELAARNYIRHSQYDPTLSDTPILLRKKVLDIEEDLVRPAFTQKLRPVSVEAEDSLELVCNFIAAPRPQITWFRDDQIVQKSDRIFLTTERDMFSYSAILEIPSCLHSDSGEYKVLVKNKEGQCQCTAKIEIMTCTSDSKVPKLNLDGLSHDEPPGRKNRSGASTPRTPTSATRRYLDRVRVKDLRAQAFKDDSRRTRSFESSFNGRGSLSSEGAHFRASSLNNILLSRSFPMRGRRAESVSSCFDDNVETHMDTNSVASTTTIRQNGSLAHSDEIRSQISDYPDSDIITQSTASTSGVFMMEDTFESRRSSLSTKREGPTILKHLINNVNVTSGNEVALTCTVTGKPRPKPVWLKDATFIQEDNDRYSFHQSGNHVSGFSFTMIIKNPSPAESGIYTFSALNVAGDASSTSKVTIHPDEEDKSEAPYFTKKLKATKSLPGKKVRLDCQLTGSSPIQVTWSKDGAELPQSDLVCTDENSPYIEFPEISLSDSGEYSVMAKNKRGVATCSASLIVEGPELA